MAKRGRKKIVFTDKEFGQLEEMAKLQCTQEEMAGIMRVDQETLNRIIFEHYKVENFSEWFKIYSAGGKKSLRRMQFDSAERGNVAMLIFLGKQYLGQSDKTEMESTQTIREIPVVFEDLT